jgi:hypothetical protein
MDIIIEEFLVVGVHTHTYNVIHTMSYHTMSYHTRSISTLSPFSFPHSFIAYTTPQVKKQPTHRLRIVVASVGSDPQQNNNHINNNNNNNNKGNFHLLPTPLFCGFVSTLLVLVLPTRQQMM